MNNDEDNYLRMGEVTEKFSVSKRSLYNWEEDGYINPIKTPGGQRRYSENELMEVFCADDGQVEDFDFSNDDTDNKEE